MSCFFLSKNGFFCCIHLAHGCIFIGVSGLIIAVVSGVYVGLVLFTVNFVWAVIATVFLAIFLLGRLFILASAGCKVCCLALVAFVFTVLSTIVACVLLFFLVFQAKPLVITLSVFFIILELYFMYVMLSYWFLCRNCCEERE